MKYKFLLVLLLIMFVSPVMAEEFVIDVNKIDINYKSNGLINKLDKEYKIETNDFEKNKDSDKKVKDYTKKLIGILFSEDTGLRRSSFLNEGYIVGDDGFNVLTSSFNLQAFYDGITPLNVSYDYIKYITVTYYSEGIITTTYLPKVKVEGGNTDLILTFVLKNVDGEYKLFLASYTTGDDLATEYNEVVDKENRGEYIGSASKSIALTENVEAPDSAEIKNLYDNKKGQVVSVSALTDAAVNSYGSGFFIRKGVVVTTWSLFLKILNNSEFIYVNDAYGNAYKVEGVIAADTNYDIVVLKIAEEAGNEVTIANSSDLKMDDKVYMISSKINTGYSISYGSFVSLNSGVLNNQLVVSESDVGAALFNKDGYVVGFNTGSLLNASMSRANSTDYIKDLQTKLLNTNYADIESLDVKEFKDKYYYEYGNEQKIDNVSSKIWKEYKKIGNIEEAIKIEPIKKSYKDNVLSIRYKNIVYGSLDTKFMTMEFEDNLHNDGYDLIYNSNTKRIYENKKYRVIIKEDLDYLIILLMEK